MFSGAAGAAGSLGGVFCSLGGADGSPAPAGGGYLSKPVIAARVKPHKTSLRSSEINPALGFQSELPGNAKHQRGGWCLVFQVALSANG